MVTWGRAWRAAGAWFGWSIVWGMAGLILIGAGVAVIIGSIASVSSIFSNGYGYNPSGMITGMIGGIAMIIIGEIITILGSYASYFKITSEVTAEEVRRLMSQMPAPQPTAAPVTTPVSHASNRICPQCGRLIDGNTKFCPQCGKQLS